MTGLFSLTSLLDEVAAKVIARGIIMQWCIMGNYAAIMSHLTTSSIYETLAWVALLWKLLSCRRSSLLTFTRNATQLAMLWQNQRWFHNFFNVIFREFSSFNHATFFDAVSWKGLQNILFNSYRNYFIFKRESLATRFYISNI